MTRDEVTAILNAYGACWPQEAETLEAIRPLLNVAAMTGRATFPAHVTGSAFLLDGDELVLIHHPYLNRWLQPGGHVDPGETPDQAAVREAEEETGLAVARLTDDAVPFDIDCHAIPANPRKGEPAHWHIDFRYLLRVTGTVGMPELEIRRVPLAELANTNPDLARIADKLLKSREFALGRA